MSNDRAKELFFQYCGNKQLMWKDGDIDEYEKFHISYEQELLWKEELAELLISKLKIGHDSSFIKLRMLINCFEDYSLLQRTLDFIETNIDQADSFLKIRYAEDFYNMIKTLEINKKQSSMEVLNRTRNFIVAILFKVLNNEIMIGGESLQILRFNKEMSHSDYLINRAKGLLAEVNRGLNS